MLMPLPLHYSVYSRSGPWLFGGTASRNRVWKPGISSAIFCLELQAGTPLPLALILEPQTAHLQPLTPVGSGMQEWACGADAEIDGAMPLSEKQSGRVPSWFGS